MSMHKGKITANKRAREAVGSSSSGGWYKSDATRDMYYNLAKESQYLPEKRVVLKDSEFDALTDVLKERNWMKVANPPEYFNPEIVLQFYANAFHDEEAKDKRWTWVNNVRVGYDKKTINNYLGKPWRPSRGNQLCKYQMLLDPKFDANMNGPTEFDIRKAVCVEGLNEEEELTGGIPRRHMTQLSQVWTSLLLRNIWPSLHVTSLPVTKANLLYSILEGHSVDIAAVMSNAIADAIQKDAPVMILPSIITDLCKFHNVPILSGHQEALKSEIDARYVQIFCQEKTKEELLKEIRQKKEPKHPPAPQGPQPSQMELLMASMQRLETTVGEMREENRAQYCACYQAHVELYRHARDSYYSPQPQSYYWPTVEEYVAQVPWPGAGPSSVGGEGQQDEDGDGDYDSMD